MKAHRLLYDSTLGWIVTKKTKKHSVHLARNPDSRLTRDFRPISDQLPVT